MTADGRWCRCYIAGEPGTDRFYLPVTYHRRGRQLTVSPKLLARVLRTVGHASAWQAARAETS